MNDYLTYLLNIFLNEENQLAIMFASSFLSSTILPGNSEIVFSAYATQAIVHHYSLYWLLLYATLGNTLGSLTTYYLAKIFPQPKLANTPNQRVQTALRFSQKYGVWVLLFSWLPIVGDLFCGIAGWLRFHFWKSVILITLGKAIRYALLLWSIYLVVD